MQNQQKTQYKIMYLAQTFVKRLIKDKKCFILV